MNYAVIKKWDIANGSGVRVSLFVSGCRHRCEGCFNREAWSFELGEHFTQATAAELLDACDKSYISGFSLLGGEPFEPENREELARLCRAFRERFPQKNIWCYTGFTLEELLSGELPLSETVLPLLREIDILVDGRFVAELKSASLIFRGSSNQRILDVKRSLELSHAVLAEL